MILGIDLGTTNCAIGYYTIKDGMVFVRNRLGEILTPSVVAIDEDKKSIFVGRSAKEQLSLRPRRRLGDSSGTWESLESIN